ncbi:M949_RS01915 family surface polysaccharide biosynthesis protein [Aquimarina sp. AU119]|uniref:M949_RS01915 family surface polysaccharide biosynthesis protein n=1 Tax=Aquimarina sp. AU119 TaxID=2108528 RepID=UPI001357552F|nr:hypothetical protein [Aquimarina sp. AU119]
MIKKLLTCLLILIFISCQEQISKSQTETSHKDSKIDSITVMKTETLDQVVLIEPSKELSKEEIQSLFTKKIKDQLGINYGIWKAYVYNDHEGEHYAVFTEHFLRTNEKEESLYDSIRAFNLIYRDKQFKINYTTNDFKKEGEESIWFWTKYSEFSDWDKDGLIDPLVIYGSSGQDMYNDGRVKILIYYKGKKIGIRHQNSEVDDERYTTVDKEFYMLPVKIQHVVKQKMQMMIEKGHAYFPGGWKKEMALGATHMGGGNQTKYSDEIEAIDGYTPDNNKFYLNYLVVNQLQKMKKALADQNKVELSKFIDFPTKDYLFVKRDEELNKLIEAQNGYLTRQVFIEKSTILSEKSHPSLYQLFQHLDLNALKDSYTVDKTVEIPGDNCDYIYSIYLNENKLSISYGINTGRDAEEEEACGEYNIFLYFTLEGDRLIYDRSDMAG